MKFFKKPKSPSKLPLEPLSLSSRIPQPKPRRFVTLRFSLLSSFCFALIFSSLAILVSWKISSARTINSSDLQQRRETISSEGDVFNRIAGDVGQSVVSVVVPNASGDSAAGTGVVINQSGLILTNKHVVAGASASVEVIDYTNTKHAGQVIGQDSANDIAFIKVPDLPASIPAAKLADSSKVKVGDKVLAIGNALGEFQNTVTSGIVSGIGRPIDISDENGQSYESLANLIQTDAAINPGNSGGPLVNINGEVIGINTAIVQDAQSLGFSIPINDAKDLIAQVEQTGSLGQKAYLGVRYLNLTEAIAQDLSLTVSEGALIYNASGRAVEPGSPADSAGLKAYDVITQVGDVKLNSSTSLSSALSKFPPNQTIQLTITRGSGELKLNVTLGSTPNN